MPDIAYIGDGVYAVFDDLHGVELRANSHDRPTDKIYLEPEVLEHLIEQWRRRWAPHLAEPEAAS